MTSTKLYGNASVEVILLKHKRDGSTVERPLGTVATKALQAYREGTPIPKPESDGPMSESPAGKG